MESLAVVLLICLGAAAYLTIVCLSTESRVIRSWAIWALVGSFVLALAATYNSFCEIAENRSELFNERCDGSVPYIPLYAVPLLLTAPILRRFTSGAVVLALGSLVIVVAIAIPMRLLSV